MGNFPTIDKFVNGVATSIKSINLAANSYQNINTLNTVVRGYVNKLASFQGATWGGWDVRGADITSRVLELAIPPGASDQQLQALEQLKTWALSKDVEISIKVIK